MTRNICNACHKNETGTYCTSYNIYKITDCDVCNYRRACGDCSCQNKPIKKKKVAVKKTEALRQEGQDYFVKGKLTYTCKSGSERILMSFEDKLRKILKAKAKP